MEENDTVKLLRECDSGVKMGISSIDDVLGNVKNDTLLKILESSKSEHEKIENEIDNMLIYNGSTEKEPGVIAKGMSQIMTGVKIAAEPSDAVIADIMTDGCNMGVKSLSRYLNQYKAADEKSKDTAGRLIKLEERLCTDVRCFL
jgi:hypothetical protein